jgi:hypothetical protein
MIGLFFFVLAVLARESAWGPGADRRHKRLIDIDFAGSMFGAVSQPRRCNTLTKRAGLFEEPILEMAMALGRALISPPAFPHTGNGNMAKDDHARAAKDQG